MKRYFSFLFGLQQSVDRQSYLKIGAGLMLFKYLVDAALIYLVVGIVWTPIDYLLPLASLRGEKIGLFPPWCSIALAIWTLPFLWIGISMTLRRAVDAGRSPWSALCFLLPILNYVLMIVLCILPSSTKFVWNSNQIVPTIKARFKSAILGIGASVAVVLVAIMINVFLMEEYGWALFAATPFVLGVVSAFIFNHSYPRSMPETLQVVILSLLLVAGTLLLFALEGLLCIAMALPFSLIVALFGGVVGRAMAVNFSTSSRGLLTGLLLIPGSAALDKLNQTDLTYEVISTIEIQAPAAKVWEHLIAFKEIESEPDWHFRLGIAYPTRASISGYGVGATRYCEFSTGAFVEPITVWDAPRRLNFDVIAQPAPLQEWSPYQKVYAPHLEGFFKTRQGEFRLIALENDNTRLEGSTWYQIDIYPQAYWRIFAEAIIGSIHQRVLQQLKKDSEL
jgi:hypothetical protein